MTTTARATTNAIDLANPNFNEPRIADPNGWERYPMGDTTVRGWTITQGRVELYSADLARTPDQTQAMELQAEDDQGAIAQSIATTPDAEVTLTWLDSPDSLGKCSGATDQQYRVRVTSGTFTLKEADFTPATGGTGAHWNKQTLTFTAKDRTARVEFISLSKANPSYCGALITNVNAQETIQAPPVDTPESTLKVWQEGGVEDKPGGVGVVMAVAITQEQHKPTNPGVIKQEFKAPTGFAWNGYAAYAYYGMNMQVKGSKGDLQIQLFENNTLLVVTGNPHVYTSEDDQDVLVYALGLEAVNGAKPGRYTDGEARIGNAPVAKLKASVIDPNED